MTVTNETNPGLVSGKVIRRLVLLLPLTFCAIGHASTITVDNLGDTGPGNCSATCTLRDAIATAAQGDVIQFAPPDAQPWTITLNGTELFIYKSVAIVGPGPDRLVIDASQKSRLVEIALGATVALSGIHLTNGIAQGAAGADASGGSSAAAGAPAYGGAFLVNPGTTLALQGTVLDNNSALGGAGGASGVNNTTAAAGGEAAGGAIYNAGFLTVSRASLVNNDAIGGVGGAIDLFPGATGTGGVGGNASGGAIVGPGQAELVNVVAANNTSAGGTGGSALVLFPGVQAGSGGSAIAGGIDAGEIVVLQFVTMVQNAVVPGSFGFGYPGDAQTGSAAASDVFAGSTVLVRNSIVASGGGSCVTGGGSFALQGVNFNSDGSCPGFTVASNLVKPAAAGLNGYVVAFPVYESPVIDAALDCEDAFGDSLTIDVEGVSRPQGKTCDVGAVESDYVFAANFEP